MAALGTILARRAGASRIEQPLRDQGVAQAADARLPYLMGPENALAHAAVLSLAGGERDGLSPLVVHGAPGVGKSRLLMLLETEWRIRQPDRPMIRIDAEGFVAACAEASHDRTAWCALRARFREVDLFVLDDLLSMARSPLALSELAFTLDALETAGAVVAVASRTAPGQWPESWLPSRLVQRLLGGLVVGLLPPGLDTRRRFVLEQARARRLVLGAEVLEALAALAMNFVELDGALAQLALASRLRRRPIDVGAVQALRDADPPVARASVRWSDVASVARAVAALFKVPLRELRSTSRRAAVVEPRHLAIYLAREWTDASVHAIGRYFGGRDPATVRHACRVTAERLAEQPELAAAVARLRGC